MKLLRRNRLVFAAGLSVAAAALLLWPAPKPPHPCRATFERVRVGMTFEEVIATVGAPPDLDSGPGGPLRTAQWDGADEGSLSVPFGEDGRAEQFGTTGAARPTGWGRLRLWLGL